MHIEVLPFDDDLNKSTQEESVKAHDEVEPHEITRRIGRTAVFNADRPVIYRATKQQLVQLAPALATPTPNLKNQRRFLNQFDYLHLLVASQYGRPLSIPDVRDGLVIQDIHPLSSKKDIQNSSFGSRRRFVFHNDLSFLDDDLIPDVISLSCVRNEEQVPTLIADVKDALGELSEEERQIIYRPEYRIKHTFNRGSEKQFTRTEQIAISSVEGVRVNVEVEPMTEAANLAHARLHEVFADIAEPVDWQPGDVLILPNRWYVHGRTGFEPHQDPSKRRWLQRINLSTNTYRED